ncbi:BQ5605_C004g03131 [Microbotryum silenes-dioicae]|uniref:BQ5605_C004g03131 protein n=1 Tax=Microbotryum silenes-dioicae TaxID=796604 RepID=A0A2X0P5B2_9BASI|nr:BQ5605_C004g03131 [Microbotryum silenes-dioicae]
MMSSPVAPSDETPPARNPRRARFDVAPFTEVDNGGSSTRSNSPEPLATPTLSESYHGLKKNLSFKSLRELELREVRSAMWRKGGRGDPGEQIYRPKNTEEAFAHAFRGGLQTSEIMVVIDLLTLYNSIPTFDRPGSLLLAGGLRALVNLFVVALRITRKRGLPMALVFRALFGPDTLRFAAMLGGFTFLYKQTYHSLRIFNPGKRGPGQEEWWHAAVAGSISGAAVWAEKPSRRVTIGQQMMVRGLQGHYNVAKRRGWINIPHGDVLLFGLACGQIMESWLMSPEALPSGYRRWITQASRVAEPCLPLNLAASRTGRFDPEQARKTITWKSGATPRNALLIEEYARAAENGDFGPPFAPCATIHPWVDTCSWVAVDRWQAVFRFVTGRDINSVWMLPVYGALHVIPPILLRSKVFMKDPQRVLRKSVFGTIRSCSFLATFVVIFQSLVCTQRNIYSMIHGKVPAWVERVLLHKGYYWVSGTSSSQRTSAFRWANNVSSLTGFLTCLSLFNEEKKRRGELAMYVLPRGMESLWSVLRRRSYVPFVPGGEILMTSLGLGMVMSTYAHEPKMLSGLVRSVLYQFIGHG